LESMPERDRCETIYDALCRGIGRNHFSKQQYLADGHVLKAQVALNESLEALCAACDHDQRRRDSGRK